MLEVRAPAPGPAAPAPRGPDPPGPGLTVQLSGLYVISGTLGPRRGASASGGPRNVVVGHLDQIGYQPGGILEAVGDEVIA